jgi:hypothetical protein
MATAAGIEAAKAFVKLYLEDSALRGGLAKLQGTISSAASGLGKVGLALGATAITGGAALVASGFTAAAASVWRFVDAGAGLDDIANRTGASAEALSQLRYAAEQSGTNLEAVEKGMRKLGDVQTQAANGSKSAAAALASVGLSASKLATMSVEDRFLAVADGIDRIQDPAAKASVAMDLLGKSGADLVPMMEGGSASIVELMQTADRLGMTITGPQAKAAAAFDDVWQSLTAALRSAGNVIAVEVLPYVTQFLELIAQALPAVLTLAKGLVGGLGGALSYVGSLAGSVSAPLTAMAETARQAFGGILDALTAGDAQLAGEIFWGQLKLAWADGVDSLGDTWLGWKAGFVDVFASAMLAIEKAWVRTYTYIAQSVGELLDYIDITGSGSNFGEQAAAIGQARIAAVERQAAAQKTARDKALEGSVNAVNYDLEQARAEWGSAVKKAGMLAQQTADQRELEKARTEWASAVKMARDAAQVTADQPNTASIATGKFTELIKDLKTGDIATRVDKAVQQAGPAQDIRTTGGAQALTRILNQGGQLSQDQQRILLEQRDVQRRLLAVTERGYIGWQI